MWSKHVLSLECIHEATWKIMEKGGGVEEVLQREHERMSFGWETCTRFTCSMSVCVRRLKLKEFGWLWFRVVPCLLFLFFCVKPDLGRGGGGGGGELTCDR